MFINDLYDADIKRIQEERPPLYREENVAWPSEALANTGPFPVGECSRSLFYKALGIPYTNKMPVRVRRICDAGIMYEDKIIQDFKDKNMYLDEQCRIEYKMPNTTNEVIFSGKIDVIINDGGVIRGIEIKSVDGYKAGKIFGEKGTQPLPAPNNLMQAMGYKFHAKNNDINGHNVDEIYLMYINRGSGCTMFFKIDIDEEGWPIITPISMDGRIHPTIHLKDVPSYDTLMSHSTASKSIDSALAELRINIYDVFSKFDTAYTYIRDRSLPPKDYEMIYDAKELENQLHCGRISKIKYNKAKKGEPTGDMKCSFCNYRTKCMADSGIRLKS
jgi:hypothetical protein